MQDYILPTFSVKVSVPNNVAISDNTFTVKIEAQYTFGKPVQGIAIVKFFTSTWSGWSYSQELLYERTVTILSESDSFDVSLIDDLGLASSGDQTIDIQVEFTESLTKKVTEASASLFVSQFAFEAVFTGAYTFVQNSIYTCTLSLRSFDGRPAPAGTKITVTYNLSKYCYYSYNYKMSGSYYCPSTQLTEDVIIDASGSVTLKVDTSIYDYINMQV